MVTDVQIVGIFCKPISYFFSWLVIDMLATDKVALHAQTAKLTIYCNYLKVIIFIGVKNVINLFIYFVYIALFGNPLFTKSF